MRWRIAVCIAVCGAWSPVAQADSTGTVTYTYDPGTFQQEYQVPSAVTRLEVTAIGAPGGTGANGAPGGTGAKVVATVSVTPGETLYVFPGSAGSSARADAYHLDSTDGGFNGGGDSNGNGGGGGGASDVERCGFFFPTPPECSTPESVQASVLVMAGGGGGGGAGADAAGGAGGSARPDGTGNPGSDGATLDGALPGRAGGGATRASGGTAGSTASVCAGGDEAGSGRIFLGGRGGALDTGGGGGGGGYYGGGGGSGGQSATCGGPVGGGGGGGAGSSYGPSGAVFAQDTSGAPRVTIRPLFAPPTARVFWPGNDGIYLKGETVPTGLSCADGPGAPGIATCIDSNGAAAPQGRLDTAHLGRREYTLTATSRDGETGTATITYRVVKAAAAAVTTRHATVTGRRTQLAIACTDGRPGDACHGTVLLEGDVQQGGVATSVVLGRARYDVPAGDHALVNVRLTKRGVTLLRHSRHHRLAARAIYAGGRSLARLDLRL